MAGKQFADTEFMEKYSEYISNNYMERTNAGPGEGGSGDKTYFVIENTSSNTSIELVTNGDLGWSQDGQQGGQSGLGIKFATKDSGNYGTLGLQAMPELNWYNVLTLPTETGTLATQNYVDDQTSDCLKYTSRTVGGVGAIGRIESGLNGLEVYYLFPFAVGNSSKPADTGCFTQLTISDNGGIYASKASSASLPRDTPIDGKNALFSPNTVATAPSARGSGTGTSSNYSNYFKIGTGGSGYYTAIAYGYSLVSSGSDKRTATIPLPTTFYRLYAVTVNACYDTASQQPQADYYNGVIVKKPSTSSTASSFTISMGFSEATYVIWMAIGMVSGNS